MDCFNLNINDLSGKNYIFPLVGLCGLFMTYLAEYNKSPAF